ncbi:MAG: uroporphyrinogen decarboxylase family protein [Armatimonadota bacterium]
MNSRERVLRAIRFETPDRVPIGYSVSPGAFLKYGQPLLDLIRSYPHDFFDVNEVKLPQRDAAHYQPDGSYYKEVTDEWGCTWVYYLEGIAGEVKRSPLADWAALKTYRCPPLPDSPEERTKAKAAMDRMKERYIGWGSADTFYERMQWLRGVEDLAMDIAEDADEVYQLADLLLECNILPRIELALEAGADVIGFGDDWGAQSQLLINPETWRRIFKPRYQRAFELVHQGGALTWMHSDGMILDIIPDFIEIGLDVINPQLVVMDLADVRQAADHKIAIYTDIDRQYRLPFGTPAEVREHIGDIFTQLAYPDGGLLYGAGIYADMPMENIKAMLDAFVEYG